MPKHAHAITLGAHASERGTKFCGFKDQENQRSDGRWPACGDVFLTCCIGKSNLSWISCWQRHVIDLQTRETPLQFLTRNIVCATLLGRNRLAGKLLGKDGPDAKHAPRNLLQCTAQPVIESRRTWSKSLNCGGNRHVAWKYACVQTGGIATIEQSPSKSLKNTSLLEMHGNPWYHDSQRTPSKILGT